MNSEGKILIVDDDRFQVTIVRDMLEPLGYEVFKAFSGEEALEVVQEVNPDVILLDVIMPGIDGYEVCEKIKNNEKTKGIQIVMLTAMKDAESRYLGLELGVFDYLSKPVDPIELTLRMKNVMTMKSHQDFLQRYNEQLEEEVKRRTKALDDSFIDTIYRLTLAAEHKDSGTAAHLKRVSHFTHFLAKEIGISDRDADIMFHASPMHDVGKIGVADKILKSTGKLDFSEFEAMKQHTVIGAKMLAGSQSVHLKSAARFAESHHEHWDGSGYPYGLKGEDIPIEGRIMIIADRYDALRSSRPYKEGMSHEKTLEILLAAEGRSACSHFDPLICEAFRDNHKVFEKIYGEHSDS